MLEGCTRGTGLDTPVLFVSSWILTKVIKMILQCIYSSFSLRVSPEFVVIHNGIITNYKELKKYLVSSIFKYLFSLYWSQCCTIHSIKKKAGGGSF